MTSQYLYGMSNHRHRKIFFERNFLPNFTHITAPLWREAIGPSGIPSQRASNTKGFSIHIANLLCVIRLVFVFSSQSNAHLITSNKRFLISYFSKTERVIFINVEQVLRKFPNKALVLLCKQEILLHMVIYVWNATHHRIARSYFEFVQPSVLKSSGVLSG